MCKFEIGKFNIFNNFIGPEIMLIAVFITLRGITDTLSCSRAEKRYLGSLAPEGRNQRENVLCKFL